ncbi:MAG: tRNA (adenosine(37)-N6)-threonylcarbamoyltransferase complex dimerization subunit type 1 TsaB [Bacteroidota bacterium]
MAKILLIESATDVCSVAIAVDGQLLALEENGDTMNHASVLTLQIEACVRRTGISLAELDAVCVSRGPGSYTSLRVGASVAKGICYALDKPLLAVDTLAALAWASRATLSDQSDETSFFVPMLDARRDEVWMAVYNAHLELLIPAEPFILDNNMFEEKISSVSGVKEAGSKSLYYMSGNGCIKARSVIFFERTVWSEKVKCSASFLNELAESKFQLRDFQDIAYFEPFYMKPPNITISNKVF